MKINCNHQEQVFTWEELEQMWFEGEFTDGIPPLDDREIEIEDVEVLECDNHYKIIE